MLCSCWITEPLILYGVNLSYFTIVFLFNTMVLITVSRQIFKLKKVDNKHKKVPVKDASTVLGLMCLLGTSWGLVFLSSGYTSYPILYIFCISNTMQGRFTLSHRTTVEVKKGKYAWIRNAVQYKYFIILLYNTVCQSSLLLTGFSIFLWMCRTARPENQKAAHSMSLSTVDTFTIEKQKEPKWPGSRWVKQIWLQSIVLKKFFLLLFLLKKNLSFFPKSIHVASRGETIPHSWLCL